MVPVLCCLSHIAPGRAIPEHHLGEHHLGKHQRTRVRVIGVRDEHAAEGNGRQSAIELASSMAPASSQHPPSGNVAAPTHVQRTRAEIGSKEGVRLLGAISPDSGVGATALDAHEADVVVGAAFVDDWCFDKYDEPAVVSRLDDDKLNSADQQILCDAVEVLVPVEKPSLSETSAICIPVSNKPRSKAAKFKSTCERRKHEIASLRREASDLKATIERPTSALAGSSSVPRNQTMVSTQWQARVQQRFRQLQQVAKENERLQLIVRERKIFAKRLQRTLKTRIVRAMHMKYTLLPFCERLKLGESPDDYSVYAKLLATTEVMRAEVDTVARALQTRVPGGGNGSFRESTIANFGSQNLEGVEVVTSTELPFSHECTSQALQLCLGGEDDVSWEYVIENFGILPGVVMDKRHVSFTNAIESGIYRIRRVCRTFALDGSTSVILVTSHIDPVESTIGGHYAQEYALLQREWKLVRQRQSRTVVSTFVQTYSTLVPEILKPPFKTFWNKEILTNIVIPSREAESSAEHQRLENILVDSVKL